MSETKNSLHVKIVSADGVIFEDEVMAVSSTNDNGPFDILPLHSNFITIAKVKIVVHLLDKSKKEFPIQEAVLKALNNSVTFYIGIDLSNLQTSTNA